MDTGDSCTLIGMVSVRDDANWARSHPTPLPAVKAIRVRDDKLVADRALEHGGSVAISTTRPFVSFPILREKKKKKHIKQSLLLMSRYRNKLAYLGEREREKMQQRTNERNERTNPLSAIK